MKKNTALGFTDVSSMFLATLLLRAGTVAGIICTLPVRGSLPLQMAEWFQRISYPLLLGNLVLLIFHKKIAAFLQRRPFVLLADLFIAAGILQIGGGWRSSYFEYTLTTIMLFTIFGGRQGACISAVALSVAGLIKDPSGGLPSFAIFDVDNWDMRIGAALFYITAGLILGYFSALLKRLEALSAAKVEETRKLTAAEEKTRMALELHDGAKQMVNAMLLKMNPIIRKIQRSKDEIADELRWLWRGMNYLKNEFDQVMDALRERDNTSASECTIIPIIEEEARIAEVMTGVSWKLSSESQEFCIPPRSKLPLRRFLSEALMNAWKHSGATTGAITLRSSAASAVIIIEDCGKGFDYSVAGDLNTTGLKSLKHRAKELNGDLIIETAPGKGCKLTLTLPPYKI